MPYYPPAKPDGELMLKLGDYVRLDVARIVPRQAGIIHHLVYINCKYRLIKPTEAGQLTIKLVREAPTDPTAYHTFDLVPVFDSRGKPKQGGLLVTHTYFETTEVSRPVSWHLMIEGATGYLGTRYAKAWQP